MTRRISFVGSGLVGKRTTLAALSATEIKDVGGGGREHLFNDVNGRTLVATVCVFRAWLSYSDPRDPNLDPRIRNELDQLAVADGFVFVLDSQPAMSDFNRSAFDDLVRDLAAFGRNINDIPIVFQANKRDLVPSVSMESLRQTFQTPKCEFVESVATRGEGAVDAVRALVQLMDGRDA